MTIRALARHDPLGVSLAVALALAVGAWRGWAATPGLLLLSLGQLLDDLVPFGPLRVVAAITRTSLGFLLLFVEDLASGVTAFQVVVALVGGVTVVVVTRREERRRQSEQRAKGSAIVRRAETFDYFEDVSDGADSSSRPRGRHFDGLS